MRVIVTAVGIKNLMILCALQGIKEEKIKAYYSGTIRRHEAALTRSDLMRYIESFFAMAVENYPDFVTVVDPDDLVDNAEVCFNELAGAGKLRYLPQVDLYALEGLYQNNFYLGTESNLQVSGVIYWGRLGYGATNDSYLHKSIPFGGITYEQFLSQFPNHGVAGNDVILCIASADAVQPLIAGWSPHFIQMVNDFRSHLLEVAPAF